MLHYLQTKHESFDSFSICSTRPQIGSRGTANKFTTKKCKSKLVFFIALSGLRLKQIEQLLCGTVSFHRVLMKRMKHVNAHLKEHIQNCPYLCKHNDCYA